MPQTESLPARVLDSLTERPKTRRELADELGARYDRINTTLTRLTARGAVVRLDTRPAQWTLRGKP